MRPADSRLAPIDLALKPRGVLNRVRVTATCNFLSRNGRTNSSNVSCNA